MVFARFFGASVQAPAAAAAPEGRARRRRRIALALAVGALVLGAALPAAARDAAPVRLVSGAAESGLLGRTLTLRLRLDGAAPFRVFTLDAPPRLVVDLEGAVAPGFAAEPLEAPAAVLAARSGPVRPGWARLVLDLDRPLALATAELVGAPPTLEVRLRRVSARAFAAASGPPPGVWAHTGPPDPAAPSPAPATMTVAIDAGHGGPDPGAAHDGLQEKDLALAFARDLAAAVARTGRLRAILTRDADVFLGLGERVGLARAAGADVLLSIHTNAGPPELAGAIVFTRSETGSDGEAAARARLENRADALGGFAAEDPDEPLVQALTGMARVETDARSALLAEALVEALDAAIAPLAPFPQRSANFIVLGASDLPSALVEIGFLSNAADRAAMTDPAWRASAAEAVAAGLVRWLVRDEALAARLRR